MSKSGTFRGMRLNKPCANCPFRSDGKAIHLSPGRRQGIHESITKYGENFTCHKHNDHDDLGAAINDPSKNITCAGMLVYLTHLKRPNTMMQVMSRLGAWNQADLNMDTPVCRTEQEFVDLP